MLTQSSWKPGTSPVAVVMISLNEAHNMDSVLKNLRGWAQEVFLVDSYSVDDTVDIALRYGVHVVQRKFSGFGEQWNFALRELPITAAWTMKIDPDERMTDELKTSISSIIANGEVDAIEFKRRLWFASQPLLIQQKILRAWKTGSCVFTDVSINEHPIVEGLVGMATGRLEHYDSPNLHHWVEKQNRYTSAEAIARYRGLPFAATPSFFGSPIERRMWFKKHFYYVPGRYLLSLLINLIMVQYWRTGRAGLMWATQRVWVRRMSEHKLTEMKNTGVELVMPKLTLGSPDPRVQTYE